MATFSEGGGGKPVLNDKKLEILGKISKDIRLIGMDEVMGELPITEDVSEAVKSYDCHKKIWTAISHNTSPVVKIIKEREDL
ncbi:hypothetical protein BGT96224_Ac30266 [Blumeria graminis f. sp. tritici 96224]|nr:hypothetical protein BGT96224_Ac30266 [Blumeria graminis f. sp. tritici 96224]